jgi:hypothetical protein
LLGMKVVFMAFFFEILDGCCCVVSGVQFIFPLLFFFFFVFSIRFK